MALITIQQVRDIIGVQEDIISDTTISNLINLTEENVKSKLNINLTPKLTIDILIPSINKSQKLIKRNPLKLLNVKIGQTNIDPSKLYLGIKSGLINFKPEAGRFTFTTIATEKIKIKYLSALMEQDTEHIDEIETSITKGDNVVVTISDGANFNTDEWVLFESLDGSNEVALITSITGNNLTINKLVNDYEEGSVITKMITDKTLHQYILYETAVQCGINAVGGSYNFNTSYSIEGVSTNLGVPYPHFEKTVSSLISLRDTQWVLLQNKLISIL
jgi:hypothetical protein